MDIKASIEDTRKGFKESFASGDFYNRQTQDAKHLERILSFIPVQEKVWLSAFPREMQIKLLADSGKIPQEFLNTTTEHTLT